MTRANPRGPRFDFDPEIERTQKQLKRRIRGLMNGNKNNGQQPADGQELPARADGVIAPPAPQMDQQLPARTVRDYLAEDLEGLNPAVTMPDFEAEHFELKPVMFNMLNTLGQFGGTPNENARQHVKSFLEICNSFKIHGVSNDVLKLKLFPYSLRDKAKTWLNNLQPGSLQSWTQLCRCFLAKFKRFDTTFTAEEVIAAFRDINPRKSPGIDGLPSGFFQHWDILGEDFVSLCLDLLRGHADMASVNETVIVLIPKVDKPTSMRQLRPISLCTVIYKTVSKVLVNRMKAILPHCISSAQAAFVQGRAITDNILVAHELVHTLHTSVSRSSQGAVFKLDMEKAFDRVEWPFLKAVMLRLGFAPSWVDLIMRCVSSVSSRVRVRGLSAALTAAQQEGHLPGVRASKHGPPVNHLLFADDSLVFLRNNMTEVQCLKDILLTYSSVSGQKVNFSKSTAYFSPRTPPAHRTAVHVALGVQEVDDPGIYLGVPLLIGKNKYAAFGRYRDKVDTRVSKWSNLLLSFSGREVLIKSVAQALPQYVMSCYFLPCSLVEEMSRSIRRFWWSGKGSARGWPLVAWDDICLPKAAGGIGFKDLHLFNIALLGKQLWRLLSAPGSLLCRTLRAKYFPDGDLFSASAPARSSFAWKGLHRAMLHLRDGFFWTLGIDSQVRLFRDRWGGFSPITLAGDSIDREEIPLRCREFMVPGQARWDRAKLLAHLPPGDVDSILEVPISSDQTDTLVWGDHDSGLYTVRYGYLFLRRPPSPLGPPPRLWKILAKLPTIPKVCSFGWRCGRDALPVGSRLRDAGLSDGACPLCGVGFEDVLHVLQGICLPRPVPCLLLMPPVYVSASPLVWPKLLLIHLPLGLVTTMV
ncbi:hypothetical protein GQ457_07G000040 [Hibiscus cannabinus]